MPELVDVSIKPLTPESSAASAYQGTLAMFERADFTVVERRQWNANTPIRPIVRLDLAGGRADRYAKRTGKLKRVG